MLVVTILTQIVLTLYEIPIVHIELHGYFVWGYCLFHFMLTFFDTFKILLVDSEI